MRRRLGQTRFGFVMADVFIGFAMLGILSVTVMTTWHQHGKGLKVLEQKRQLAQHAEAALSAMQMNEADAKQYVEANPDLNIQFKRINSEAPEGFVWMGVAVKAGDDDVSILGLVPSVRLQEGTQ